VIVADASGLVALGSAGVLDGVAETFDVRTAGRAIAAVEVAAARHGPAGDGARAALARRDRVAVVEPEAEPIRTSRLDGAAGSAVALARELDAAFLLVDDDRAIHELRRLAPGDVVTPAIVLCALVRRGALSGQDARFRLDALLDRRRGLEAAVGRRGRRLLDGSAT